MGNRLRQIIPTPKSAAYSGAMMAVAGRLDIAAAGAEAVGPVEWLGGHLQAKLGVRCRRAESTPEAHVVVGLLDELERLGLASPSWHACDPFVSRFGGKQGYVLHADEQRAVLAALEPHGLWNAAASLVQLAEPGGIQCAHIEDAPDFRFRAADWLLNGEINRWAYERGDGREALFERLRRKTDLAARYKLNLIWFDGFGWDPDRVPGYAEAVRGLARYARARGVRLAHCGYGGGYGFAYQKSQVYDAPYMGQTFENRRPYPDGELYDCIGHPAYEDSWRYGTCLSNEGLLDAKLSELTRFVRACEPGLLYIHDIDTGDWELAAEGWLRRCEECRRRWPNDDAGAEDGMAGAYAAWFRRLTSAVAAVSSEDGEYVAQRDCVLAFVGPVYTAAGETDEEWEAECSYFETVSRLVGPAANVQFGIREQLVSNREPRLRVAELSERLQAVGNGHGVFVICFAGGDGYYSDQLVSPAATLSPYFLGAETAYVVGLGGIAEAGQVVSAEYGWNASAAGAVQVAGSHEQALRQLQAAREGALRPEELYDAGALLDRACAQQYGPCAGALLAQVFNAADERQQPVAMIWHTVTREAQRLAAGEEASPAERREHWLSRERATRRAVELVREALECQDVDGPVQGDLDWLLRCLRIGEAFCEGLAKTCEVLGSHSRAGVAELGSFWEGLSDRIGREFAREWFDPVGGDVGAWQQTIELLRSVTAELA